MTTSKISTLLKSLTDLEYAPDSERIVLGTFYWTKKNPLIAAKIIESFLPKGGTVLDPFLGSGSTVYALNHLHSRYSIFGVELNEMPLMQLEFNILEKNIVEINFVENKMKDFMEKYEYLYEYILNNKKIRLLKTILDLDKEKIIPKEFTYLENGIKKIAPTGSMEFISIKSDYLARQKAISLQLDEDLILEHNSRIAIKQDMKLSSIFSPISFYILLEYKKTLSKYHFSKYTLSQILHKSKYTDLRTQSQFPFWIPKTNVIDRNILELINKKIFKIRGDIDKSFDLFNTNNVFKKTKKSDNEFYSLSHKVTLINKPIQKLTVKDIKNESIDLVFTDPPYFDQVAYSEYLKIWEFFTGLKSNLEEEIVVSNRINARKNRTNYLNEMDKAIQIVRKKMKNEAFCIIYFKDSKLNNLYDLINIFTANGFAFNSQHHITKPKYTYKQNTTPETTVSGDCLMIFQKTDQIINLPIRKEFNLESKKKVNIQIQSYLRLNGPSKISEIYDNFLIKYLYDNGLLHNFTKSNQIFSLLLEGFEYNPETRKIIEIYH